MKKKTFVLSLMLLVLFVIFLPGIAFAEPVSVNASDWAKALYDSDSGMSFSAVKGAGSLWKDSTYTAGSNEISNSLVLTTVSGETNSQMAMDGTTGIGNLLSSLSGYAFGDHLSYVEVETVALGAELSFNYAFCSSEFDQPVSYNDSFGLFYSVKDAVSGKWSGYTNVAIIPGTKSAVNIKNLKSANMWSSNGSLDVPTDIASKPGRGYTSIFEAKINDLVPGSKIRVLFAICDITDYSYDSAVIIEAGSFTFTKASVDYSNECLYDLEPQTNYQITFADGSTVIVASDSNGRIPMEFIKDGETYSMFGKKISIKIANTSGAIPKKVDVSARPNAPENPPTPPDLTGQEYPRDVVPADIICFTDKLIVNQPVDGQEYSIDGGNTWLKPGSDGTVQFTGLAPNTEYEIITRLAATELAPASLPSSPAKATTLAMLQNLSIKCDDYEGVYDAKSHGISVTVEEAPDAVISYAASENERYVATPPAYVNAGTYTVYYRVTKDGYYPAYGVGTVIIKKAPLAITSAELANITPDINVPVEILSVDLSGLQGNDILINGTDYTAAGEYSATDPVDPLFGGNVDVTVTLLDTVLANNYEPPMNTTVPVHFQIPPTPPQTGDSTDIGLLIIVMVCSAAGLVLFSRKGRAVK